MLFEGESIKLFYTIIQNKNNRLSILESDKLTDIKDLEKVLLKKKIPVCVCVTGRGLVYKKVISQGKETDYDALLAQSFPTVNRADFYIQHYTQINCDGFVSLFRKEQLKRVTDLLKNTKLNVAALFLGYGFVADAMPLTTLFNSIETNDAVIEFSNGCVEAIKQNETDIKPQEIKIEDLKLTKNNVLGFALCFTYLLNTKNCFNYNQEIESYKQRHNENAKLKALTYSSVALAFFFCLFNFFFFNYYFSKNSKLESELKLYEGKYEKINELLNSYESKKNLIEGFGLLDETKISRYADRIAATVPKEVVLCEWVISKPSKLNEEDSLLKFEKKVIEIKGKCNKSLIINEWVNVLKSQNFIKDVDLAQFSFDNEGERPNFELKIVTE
jgi:hypothetical protein